ncbi:hypothetical protein PHSC3_000404 [Chlamydiales bacterium STE3]|nr:hypothetical protein PHSC3_000404 [Chlamydiales bacterium STE3]
MNIEIANEGEASICQAQAKLYAAFGKLCEKTVVGRFLGLPLFIADSSLECAKSCCKVGERFFKGCLNLRNAAFEKDAVMKKGRFLKAMSQLREAVFYTAASLPLPIFLLVNSLATPLFFLFRGNAYANDKVTTFEQEAQDLLLSDEQKKEYKIIEHEEKKKLKNIFQHQKAFWEEINLKLVNPSGDFPSVRKLSDDIVKKHSDNIARLAKRSPLYHDLRSSPKPSDDLMNLPSSDDESDNDSTHSPPSDDLEPFDDQFKTILTAPTQFLHKPLSLKLVVDHLSFIVDIHEKNRNSILELVKKGKGEKTIDFLKIKQREIKGSLIQAQANRRNNRSQELIDPEAFFSELANA